eukprot:CAMPEP_0202966610 /NCGR_PEP_ID=MMETSP1396-20130829/11113_1 /ASSEMBLY_ACC=CAM_ASM_000872 /TAXON_ID= /ORGANISM="Pseudokeronopsis sp., Strain Brazil" /LENGTH=51 /DNA_ID=CAMNT_0049690705 /DNA_START=815 /DNA_END=970 /DNA_ORIENTATION=+
MLLDWVIATEEEKKQNLQTPLQKQNPNKPSNSSDADKNERGGERDPEGRKA